MREGLLESPAFCSVGKVTRAYRFSTEETILNGVSSICELNSISLEIATHRLHTPSLHTIRLGAPSLQERSVGQASLNLILWLLRLGSGRSTVLAAEL